MGKRTSIYLADDVDAAVRASGVPLGELVRRGLEARAPEQAAADLAGQAGAEAVRDEMRQIAAEMIREAREGVADSVSEELRGMRAEIRELRESVRGASGGSW